MSDSNCSKLILTKSAGSEEASALTPPDTMKGGVNSQDKLTATLQASNLFKMLDTALLEELTAELIVMKLSPGQTLVKQGDTGDAMYVVLGGRLKVVIENEEGRSQFRRMVGVYESIGEIALLTGQTRTATVIAASEAIVAKLTKASYEQLASRSPLVGNALADAITDLIRRRQLRTALNSSHLLNEVEPKLQEALEAEFELLSLRSGERLFQQGDEGDGMYLVVSGRLQVVLEDKGTEMRVLRELGRSESLGEIALLTEQPRTATVYAIRDTEVAKLSRESYCRLATRFPLATTRMFTQPITDLVVSRDRRHRPPAGTPLALALIPTHPDILLTEFSQRLTKAFAQMGPTCHLNSRRVDEILGKSGIAQTTLAENRTGSQLEDKVEQDALDAQLVNWLGEQEAEHRYLIYEADATLTPWTERAVRQADLVLIVGRGSDDPMQGELELSLNRQAVPGIAKQQRLILLHRGGQENATGTAAWLAVREVQDHYHVRWHGGDKDFTRLARILAGQAVGLVLSGGGARGMAHIGVLRALEEAEIPIDLIGGVSAGSLTAGLYAMGYDLAAIQQHIDQFTRNASPFGLLGDFTLPIVAFTTGHAITQLYRHLLGETQIEDLYLPYFCVSANLSQARDHVHRSGSLWQAVRASSTVPGMLPPMVHEGDLLIDGGLYNNLPLDAMRARNPHGKVIGIDVMATSDLADVVPYGAGLSGWRALANRFSSQRKNDRMPNLASLLVRTLEVSSVQSVQDHLAAGLADLYLRPPVAQFGFFEFGAVDRIIEIGYQYAKEQLAKWKMNSPEQDVGERRSLTLIRFK
ncbi:MAG: cyclic nucleotide-binding and patatin-like phospholipase domain-containing protein [Chloroflexota bacterium]